MLIRPRTGGTNALVAAPGPGLKGFGATVWGYLKLLLRAPAAGPLLPDTGSLLPDSGPLLPDMGPLTGGLRQAGRETEVMHQAAVPPTGKDTSGGQTVLGAAWGRAPPG